MNQLTPISNILIGLIILFLIGLALLVLKFSYRQSQRQMDTDQNKANIRKIAIAESNAKDSMEAVKIGLQEEASQVKIDKETIMNEIFEESPNRILILSFLLKYTLIGVFFNSDKKYLLKEFSIVSLFIVCALGINDIILWPVVVGFGFFVFCILTFEYLMKAQWQCFQNFELEKGKKRHQIHCRDPTGEISKSRLHEFERDNLGKCPLENENGDNRIEVMMMGAISHSNSDNNLHFEMPGTLTNLNEVLGEEIVAGIDAEDKKEELGLGDEEIDDNNSPPTKRKNPNKNHVRSGTKENLENADSEFLDEVVAVTRRTRNGSSIKKKLSPVKLRKILQSNVNATNTQSPNKKNIKLPSIQEFRKSQEVSNKNKSPGKLSQALKIQEIPMVSESKDKQIPQYSLRSRSEIVIITAIAFLTVLLLSKGMFTIYDSLSDLGILNLKSWLLMLAIDQLGIRPMAFLLWFGTVKGLDLCGILQVADVDLKKNVVSSEALRGIDSDLQNKAKNDENLGFQSNVKNIKQIRSITSPNSFQKTTFRDNFLISGICEDFLYEKMVSIREERIKEELLRLRQLSAAAQKGTMMRVSPTRMKENSPSRVPMAIKNEGSIARSNKNNCGNRQEDNTQLNLIALDGRSKGRTERRQDILGQDDGASEVQEYDMENQKKNREKKSREKNFHSYSAQRPIKTPESILKIHNFNDDMLLVDNVLNYIDENRENGHERQKNSDFGSQQNHTQNGNNPNQDRPGLNTHLFSSTVNDFNNFTVDVDFSPTRHVRRRVKTRANKRTMVITGSSPYLEYLPNMMKKVERVQQMNLKKKEMSSVAFANGIGNQENLTGRVESREDCSRIL